MAKMLPHPLLFASPTCRDCGMLSDPESTYYGEDFHALFCTVCRKKMDGIVNELAEELMQDPSILNAYRHHPKEQQEQLLFALAEDIYFFSKDTEDEG